MSVSVVIPTRDRPLALRRCLASIGRHGALPLDVIVVDDGGLVPESVAALAAEFDASTVRLEGVGPAAARNAGVAAARGEIVLLLDDDCVVDPEWAEKLVEAVTAGDRVVAAGAVRAPDDANVWLRASERIAVQAEVASLFFRTMNLACRRELLVELPFDESFRTAGGEDRDWCVRAARAGVFFARISGVGVDHRSTLDARSFVAQQERYGRAARHLRARGTHARVPSRALLGGVVSGLRESPAVGIAMLAGHALAAAGYIRESRARRAAVG
jgi:GT2 family glycosyltransferase